jgi:hypothetical protein
VSGAAARPVPIPSGEEPGGAGGPLAAGMPRPAGADLLLSSVSRPVAASASSSDGLLRSGFSDPPAGRDKRRSWRKRSAATVPFPEERRARARGREQSSLLLRPEP